MAVCVRVGEGCIGEESHCTIISYLGVGVNGEFAPGGGASQKERSRGLPQGAVLCSGSYAPERKILLTLTRE